MQKIMNWDKNHKTVKGQKQGYMTGILYLAPAHLSGVNVCPYASPGCTASCLNTAGMGRYGNVQEARIKKTKSLFADKAGFIARIEKEIGLAIGRAERKKMKLTIRLNGTSDLNVESWGLMEKFPKIQFYDYTKNPFRMDKFLNGGMPKNYNLIFSLSETNEVYAKTVLARGGNIVAVFKTKDPLALPKTFWGYKTVNGENDDLRFKDGKNKVVALKMKGRAMYDKTGFVRELPAKENALSLAA
jgi:hypothetical protein